MVTSLLCSAGRRSMGKYDNLDRQYFSDPERAAELFTVGIFHRRINIEAEDIKPIERTYPSLVSASGSVERDAIFVCEAQRIKYGLEIETSSDYSMPRRFLTYDACEYEKEAGEIWRAHETNNDLERFEEIKSRMKASDRYHPVINLLLYLGQGHFRGHDALRGLFAVPEDIKPFVFEKIQNYSYALLEAEHIDPEEFRTDLKFFFRAMQCRKDKHKLKALMESKPYRYLSTETQRVIALHLNVKELTQKVVEEEMDMCRAYRELIADERAEAHKEGLEEGISQGISQGIRQGIREGINQGLIQALTCLEQIKSGTSARELEQQGYSKELIQRASALLS